MFQNQLNALRRSISQASKMSNFVKQLEAKEEAFTFIINEKLETPHRTTNVAAILFLEDHEIRSVYCKRADVYKRLGNHALGKRDYENAVDCFERAEEDLKNAIEYYEELYIKYDLIKKLREIEELTQTAKNTVSTEVTSGSYDEKEEVEEDEDNNAEETVSSSSTKRKATSSYTLRSARMWNPKQEYENLTDRLDAQQKSLYKRLKVK